MKVLVTGGAGFIGSNFIHYWLREHPDDQVLNLDKLTYAGNLANLATVQDNANYAFMCGDICEREDVERAMQGVDIVVHFAAESHVDRSIADASSFVRTNVLGTHTLLEEARRQGIRRFHHISTDEVFGALPLDSQEQFNEATPYAPRNPYSASKAGSDHLARAYAYTFGLPVTITNCSNNFGPFMFPEKFIPLAITNILDGKKIPVYGDGLYTRDWLYVEDHCRAIELVLEKGQDGETYLVGGMTELQPNIEVARKIATLLGRDESWIEHVPDRLGHDRKYDVDWSRIRRELGWYPLFPFDEWLERTVDWYRTNERWWRDVKTGKYREYSAGHDGAHG